MQGCGSGFNGVPGSGSRMAKMAHKHTKKLINFIFRSTGCSIFRAEGFSCSLDIAIFDQKKKKIFLLYFFLKILVIKPWIQIVSGSGSVSVSGFT
jgi:hypothetical protein